MLRLIAYAHDGVKRCPVGATELTVGSGPESDFCLPYVGVSPLHARLHREGDILRIEDLGSRKGVVVNGERVRQTRLEPLDEIRLGTITLLLEDVAAEPRGEEAEEAAPEPQASATAESLAERLAEASSWVLSDIGSRRTVEHVMRRILVELGGGCAFLWSGSPEKPGSRFAVATRSRWLTLAEPLSERFSPELGTAFQSAAEEIQVDDAELWVFRRSLRAMDRSYLFVVALPAFAGDTTTLRASLCVLADLLVLGLVHHVGRYEPILPGHSAHREIVLAPGFILGASAPSDRLLADMKAAIPCPNVLVLGEPGSGRELVARTLHLSSTRADGPLLVSSGGGAQAQQVEADLFGGEVRGREGPVRREGKIAAADGGTLVLCDVDALPLEVQDRLARLLRTREIEEPGGAARPVDVRIIVTSRLPLEALVARDSFRVDLAYRLSQFAISVPPLRERREDLPLLVQGLINRFSHESGNRVQGVTVRALACLTNYDHPGNLSELESIVRQMVYLCPTGEPVDVNLLPRKVRTAKITPTVSSSPTSDLDLQALVADCEQAAIREALRRTTGNKTQAARELGLSRNGLALKMERYEIH